MPHFNFNLPTLIPKKEVTNGFGDYHPIALANFVFKIITKIFAGRLGLNYY